LPEIVCLTKTGGPLTKKIRLENGVLRSDGSALPLLAQGALNGQGFPSADFEPRLPSAWSNLRGQGAAER
jgi:hypothetical protein